MVTKFGEGLHSTCLLTLSHLKVRIIAIAKAGIQTSCVNLKIGTLVHKAFIEGLYQYQCKY